MACGGWIDAAFATFQGRDPDKDLAIVFAHVVQRYTKGREDPSANPLRVEGAGWAGFVGFNGLSRLAVFDDPRDGCRAAAVVLHGPEHAELQAAYRAADPLALALAIESGSLGASGDLAGLARAVRASLVRRRGLSGILRTRVDRLYATVITQNTP